ncbi:hypothetical protein [Campylobacter helveticus]|uniref:hypothetical protein n=1 Tax=Campylobacter helveticus TaxID=28898 RepID=UPI0022EA8A62|nr:hypothetical protein [Campylobacter helveticus]
MRFVFTINDENYKLMKKYSQKFDMSMGAILNRIIKESLSNKKTKVFNDLSYKEDELDLKVFKEHKVKLSEEETKIVKELAQIHLHNSIKKELRFIILNAIYNEKIFSQVELKSFILTKTALNAIGRNLNQFVRELKKRNLITLNNKEVEKNISSISHKIDELCEKLEKLITKTERVL